MTTETSSPAPRRRRAFGAGAVLAIAIASAAAAGGGAWLLAQRPGPLAAPGGATGAAAEAPRAQYQCPMHPTIVQDHPGDCPICGMKLVKVDAASGASGGSPPAGDAAGAPVPGLATVDIDPSRQQLIGLRTVEVTRGSVGGSWRTVGRVAIDETRVRHVNLKIPTYVERVYVDFVGKPVRKGEPLFSVYSPELLSAQEEFVLALKTRRSLAGAGGLPDDGDALVAAARRKLQLWDIPDAEIDRLARTGLPTKNLTIYSPIAGVVTRKDVVEGMKLDAGAMPYEIVDLSQVWVLADVYEGELRNVKVGLPATLTLNAYPDRPFQGRVLFVDPLLDPKTRTVKVRLAFPNPTGELKPEMFGEVVLRGAAREGLRIPTDAVIDSGTGDVVFVAVGEGRFQPREVRLGASDGQTVEVVSGVSEGEQVVTRANFLIDSESRLRASLAGMAAKQGGGPAAAAPPAPAARGRDAGPGAAGHGEHGGKGP
jgi:Cu(I)/Ag(I) efflux system membrane fusion protein